MYLIEQCDAPEAVLTFGLRDETKHVESPENRALSWEFEVDDPIIYCYYSPEL
jgi:hypothetical protein